MKTKIWCPDTNRHVDIPNDPTAVKVWNMNTQTWVHLKKWMRYCSCIWTNGHTEEQWNIWFPPPEKTVKVSS